MYVTNESKQILQNFPNVKLSYETIIHKKVYKSDIIYAIPKGKKCFVWFTYYKGERACIILEYFNNKVKNIQVTNVSCKEELFLGTIMYGTLFTCTNNNNLFTIENLHYYKGDNTTYNNWHTKLETIHHIMQNEIRKTLVNSSFLIFGLPIISNDVNDIIQQIRNVNYPIQNIQFMLFNNSNRHLSLSMDKINTSQLHISNTTPNTIPNTKYNTTLPKGKHHSSGITNKNRRYNYNKCVFQVKAELQNDIYNLYCYNQNNVLQYYDKASVPSYATSVLLNNLFRNIKENDDLDVIEESEDEEEFENEELDKYVDINKSYKMLCEYNYKHNKWVPKQLAKERDVICNIKDISNPANRKF